MLTRSLCKHIDWIVLTSLKLTFASDLSGVRISYLVTDLPQIIADSFFLFPLFYVHVSPNREMTRFAYTSACRVGTQWTLDAFWQWIFWNICWHHLPMIPRLCPAFYAWAGRDWGQACNCSSRICFVSAFNQAACPPFNYVIQSLFHRFAMKRFATTTSMA